MWSRASLTMDAVVRALVGMAGDLRGVACGHGAARPIALAGDRTAARRHLLRRGVPWPGQGPGPQRLLDGLLRLPYRTARCRGTLARHRRARRLRTRHGRPRAARGLAARQPRP